MRAFSSLPPELRSQRRPRFPKMGIPQIYFEKLACFSPPQNHHDSTTFSPATHHVFTTQTPRKNAHFLQNPLQKPQKRKMCAHWESLTLTPEHGTLFKFGAVAHVSSFQGLQRRQALIRRSLYRLRDLTGWLRCSAPVRAPCSTFYWKKAVGAPPRHA